MDKKPRIIYYKSGLRPDDAMIDLFKKQADIEFVSRRNELMEINSENITMIVLDLRNESDYGNRKIDEVQILTQYSGIPMTAVCDKNKLNELICAMNHNLDILEIPLNRENLIRRCNRVCHMLSISAEEDK